MKKTLRDLRSEKGVSQTRMGEDLNFTQATISKWELGKKVPIKKNIKRLSAYFGVSEREILQAAANSVESEKRHS